MSINGTNTGYWAAYECVQNEEAVARGGGILKGLSPLVVLGLALVVVLPGDIDVVAIGGIIVI